MEHAVERALVESNLPGCVLAVVAADGGIDAVARGVGRIGGADDPVRAASQFRVGSLTKLATTLAAIDLRDAGRLSLEDSPWRWLPGPRRGPQVTLRQLLSHAAGLIRGPYVGDARPVRAADVRWALRPGADFKYSNLGFEILAGVIERAADEPFSAYVRRRVLAEAGATAAGFDGDRPGPRAAVVGHLRAQYREVVLPSDRLRPAPRHRLGVGSTGLWCSATDFCRLLTAATSRWRLPAECPPTSRGWGLGVGMGRLFDEPCLYLTGGHFGYSAYTVWLPGRRVGGAALANRGSAHMTLLRLLHDAVAPAWAAAGAGPARRHRLAARGLAGVYRGAAGTLRVHQEADALWLAFDDDPPARAEQVAARVFVCLDGRSARRTVRFHVADEGPRGASSGPDFFFGAGAAAEGAAPEAGWRRCCGRYRSAITGEAQVHLRGGQLIVAYSALEEAALSPWRGAFLQRGGPFHAEPFKFLATPAGEVHAFRAGGMRYTRL